MKKQSGFTLIELMIVVAIVAILAAIAMPAYKTYTAKARFSEVINAVNPVKAMVELCFLNAGDNTTDACDLGASGEGWSFAAAANGYAIGHIATIDVTDGVITATADSTGGLSGQNYILRPSANNGSLAWTVDAASTCKTNPDGSIC